MTDPEKHPGADTRKPVTIKNAAGVSGILIRTLDGKYDFRIYDGSGNFIDYSLRHDDLSVTISPDELACFYDDGERQVLDHSPEVLGYTPLVGRSGIQNTD